MATTSGCGAFIIFRLEFLIFGRAWVQAFQLQAIAGGRVAVLEDLRETNAQQQAAGVLPAALGKEIIVLASRHVLALLVEQVGHLQRDAGLVTVQTQGFLEVLLGLGRFLHLQRNQAEVLEDPRALGIEGVLAGLQETLVGLLVALLLVEETAVVVQYPGIAAIAGERLAVLLVGQLGLHLGLEHHRQRGMRVGAGRVDLEGLAQRHLGLLGIPPLEIAEAELDIGIARLVTALVGFQGILISARHAACQPNSQQEHQRGAYSHRNPPLTQFRFAADSDSASWRTAI